ncbi:hypothetical protein EDM54_24210 [Brevibacillus borstelensis]|uniref:hypothetical protein n=1 Tax=Brevibacillus borstelensis TaxID=45462 RepID=UPI000F3B33B0|nr:hypothetical protein [Brevibacillus borstelensis]MED1885967.1 hypothetical protein [Brevibacillus borstelensis]RNB56096.1 hypothetical protein EDM54_24210 [Brevibacillus borstelensis]GED55862.1 hypothetical protein BBO01nite_51030 [Brevibacillus borstelensis]
MKKRQRNKILKIVARQINSGDFTKLKPVHFRCVSNTISDYIDRKYITEWRPWWYDQIDNWNSMSLADEHKKFFDKCLQEIQEWTGIDMEKYHKYFELNHKEKPKKRRVNRKPRKEKEKPIRKLRNPRVYKIHVNLGGGATEWRSIIAEPAFQYRGYEFFIAHYEGWWCVSDVATGRRIVEHDRYKKAIEIAKERIERNFDKYVAQVERFREEATA